MAYCKKFFVLLLILFILLFNLSSVFAIENIPDGYNLIQKSLLISNAYFGKDGDVLSAVNTSIYYIDISNFSSVLYFNTKELRYSLVDNLDFAIGDNIGVVNVIQSNNDGIYLDTSSITQHYLVLSYFVDNTVDIYGKDYTAMTDGVQGLVDNVGIGALWNIFGNTTSYILIAVTVALGLFLLVCVIRGISKTKTKF